VASGAAASTALGAPESSAWKRNSGYPHAVATRAAVAHAAKAARFDIDVDDTSRSEVGDVENRLSRRLAGGRRDVLPSG
jgi:hypothetical protein